MSQQEEQLTARDRIKEWFEWFEDAPESMKIFSAVCFFLCWMILGAFLAMLPFGVLGCTILAIAFIIAPVVLAIVLLVESV